MPRALKGRSIGQELLFLTDDRTPLLLTKQAILVGRLFTAGGEEEKSLPRALESASGAEFKSSRHWGNFILVRCSDSGASFYRDPSGSVAAYRLTASDEGIFFSDAGTALALGLLEGVSIDPRFALHWLQFPFLRTAGTGLSFVREIIPGTSIGRSGSGGWNEKHRLGVPRRSSGETRRSSTQEL